jgi:hypothetical protein
MTNPKEIMRSQALLIAEAIKSIGNTPFENGTVSNVLKKGTEPLRLELQHLYMKGDPTGIGGSVGIYVDIQKGKKKKKETVYIGPSKRISRGWQLWYILNWGKISQGKTGTTITPGGRYIDKALSAKKDETLKSIFSEYEKELTKLGKRLGFQIKNN